MEWVDDYGEAKRLAGKIKQYSSHQVRDVLPGQVWGEDGSPKRVKDPGHERNVVPYVLDHVDEGAWVWRPGDP